MENRDGSITSSPVRSRGHPRWGAVSHQSPLALPQTRAMYPQRQPSVLLPRRVQGVEFLPHFAYRQSSASPRPSGLPKGMFVQGHVPGQSVFPGSGRGAGGSSESAFQGRTNFRRRSVLRRQPGHVSGEKCSCNEAVLTLPACQCCSQRPSLMPQLLGALLSLHA